MQSTIYLKEKMGQQAKLKKQRREAKDRIKTMTNSQILALAQDVRNSGRQSRRIWFTATRSIKG